MNPTYRPNRRLLYLVLACVWSRVVGRTVGPTAWPAQITSHTQTRLGFCWQLAWLAARLHIGKELIQRIGKLKNKLRWNITDTYWVCEIT